MLDAEEDVSPCAFDVDDALERVSHAIVANPSLDGLYRECQRCAFRTRLDALEDV